MRSIIILGAFALCAGWLAFPLAAALFSGNCTTQSLLIYDEPDRSIYSQSLWVTARGGEQHYYTSKLTVQPDHGAAESYYIERTIKTTLSFYLDSAEVTTANAFRIAGPDTSDPRVGHYIDPLSEKGFTARVYFFRTGERILSGFRNRPLVLCQRH